MLPPPPAGAHYFTTILWRRDSLAGAQCHPPRPFKQSGNGWGELLRVSVLGAGGHTGHQELCLCGTRCGSAPTFQQQPSSARPCAARDATAVSVSSGLGTLGKESQPLAAEKAARLPSLQARTSRRSMAAWAAHRCGCAPPTWRARWADPSRQCGQSGGRRWGQCFCYILRRRAHALLPCRQCRGFDGAAVSCCFWCTPRRRRGRS